MGNIALFRSVLACADSSLALCPFCSRFANSEESSGTRRISLNLMVRKGSRFESGRGLYTTALLRLRFSSAARFTRSAGQVQRRQGESFGLGRQLIGCEAQSDLVFARARETPKLDALPDMQTEGAVLNRVSVIRVPETGNTVVAGEQLSPAYFWTPPDLLKCAAACRVSARVRQPPTVTLSR